jgi:hypothetical protein
MVFRIKKPLLVFPVCRCRLLFSYSDEKCPDGIAYSSFILLQKICIQYFSNSPGLGTFSTFCVRLAELYSLEEKMHEFTTLLCFSRS